MKSRSRLLPILFTSLAIVSISSFASDDMGKLVVRTGPGRQFPADVPLIVPGYLATQEFSQSSGTFSIAQRVQQVYGASEFPNGPILIRGIYWRPSPSDGFAFRTVVPDIQVNLSTTSKQPDGLSPAFADNVGLDDQVVFNGPLKLSSHFQNAAAGTKRFNMFLRLQHPFYYDPTQGNLLLDIHNFQGSAASNTDAYGLNGDGGSRAIALDPNATSADFTDTGIDPIQIIFTRVRPKKPSPSDEPKTSESVRNSTKSPVGLVALSLTTLK
jgi:hypothetical protein